MRKLEEDRLTGGFVVLQDEIKEHLINDLIPFWDGLKDDENGGYFGYLGYDLKLDKKAIKGCILNSRILWFFSNAYTELGDEKLLADARQAYDFLMNYCLDKEKGGVYWSVDYKGVPADTTKHTYNQAFAIYGLSSYYRASGDEEALSTALKLYNLIEEKCTDKYGYMEAFDRDFNLMDNDKLSENGVMAEKTMNTLLHVFEAYTELYLISGKTDVVDSLRRILDTILDKVYNKKEGRQEVFFDKKWNSLIDLYSYGHDIETAWLLDRGLDVLNDDAYKKKFSAVIDSLTENIYNRAYTGHSIVNEAENGKVDTKRVWWIQAEAVVGFLNGYKRHPNEGKYLEAAADIWNYIKEYVIDKRQGSEWYFEVDENGEPIEKPIVEAWKCPYHNGRMCLEVMRRLKHDS
jgi:N-acyl-D-glucosamine 2-epimerase